MTDIVDSNTTDQRDLKFSEKLGVLFSRSSLHKKFRGISKKTLFIGTFLLAVMLLVVVTNVKSANMDKSIVPSPTPSPVVTLTTIPTPTLAPTPVSYKVVKTTLPVPTTGNITPTPTVVKSQTNNAISPTATPTPAPARTANPPQVEILFPSEGQIIKYSVNNNSRNICVGYVSRGGDTTDSKFKYSLDGGVWSGYMPVDHLCYDAHDGTNTVQMQFTNRYNEETSVITRSFVFENN